MTMQQDLRFPQSWEERAPTRVGNVLFVPKAYSEHEKFIFPSWSEVFGNERPVHIEYCSGNGMWIFQRAKAHPGVNFVAVEKRLDRVKKIWKRARLAGIDNLFIICGAAETFTSLYVKEARVDAIFVNFPDPWPKARHAKHRIFQQAFITEIARISARSAIVTITTDHPLYAQEIIEKFQESLLWQPVYPAPFFLHDLEGYGSSFFEDLWRSRGCLIHYMQFKKL